MQQCWYGSRKTRSLYILHNMEALSENWNKAHRQYTVKHISLTQTSPNYWLTLCRKPHEISIPLENMTPEYGLSRQHTQSLQTKARQRTRSLTICIANSSAGAGEQDQLWIADKQSLLCQHTAVHTPTPAERNYSVSQRLPVDPCELEAGGQYLQDLITIMGQERHPFF